MIDNIAVGKFIAKLRQEREMTQQQLAAALNVSHQAVSKWENGAALPDIQTLMALTRLFGVTVEQLLGGEAPERRVEAEQPARAVSPIEGALRDIGNFVNGIFRPAEKPEATGAGEGETESGDGADAPAEAAGEPAAEPEEPFDVQQLLSMAPFMSKAAVDAMLLEHRASLTSAEIARFAPFISRECLEKLIQNPETEITWETLQRIAPFLKREMVDKLAKIAAKGGRTAEDLGRSIEDVSQKIGAGMEKALRKAAKLGGDVANEVTNAFSGLVDGGGRARAERAEALRRAALERALQDEKWDWIAEHIKGVRDEAFLKEVAQKANALGMHDWVLEHLNGYADTRTIDAAIEAGNWGWLGDHAWQFEDALQEKIALAAAKAENWQWLSTYAEQISLEHCADQIGIAAYSADAHVLALQLAEGCMSEEQREALANAAVAAGDYDFLARMNAILSDAYFGRLCVARAQEKNWERVEAFVRLADRKSVEQLMELAIAEGNFEAIDMLNPLLD